MVIYVAICVVTSGTYVVNQSRAFSSSHSHAVTAVKLSCSVSNNRHPCSCVLV